MYKVVYNMVKILFFEKISCFAGWNLNFKSAQKVLKFGVHLVHRTLRPMVKR